MEIYKPEDKIGQLYQRIENSVSEQDCKNDSPLTGHSIEDIVIEGTSTRLVGTTALPNSQYDKTPSDKWAIAGFRPEPAIDASQKIVLVNSLEEHFGPATRKQGDRLFYKIEVGHRDVMEHYFNGEFKTYSQPITVTMLLQIEPYSCKSDFYENLNSGNTESIEARLPW